MTVLMTGTVEVPGATLTYDVRALESFAPIHASGVVGDDRAGWPGAGAKHSHGCSASSQRFSPATTRASQPASGHRTTTQPPSPRS